MERLDSTLQCERYQPTSYQSMDDWLNSLSLQQWVAIIGAYASGGFTEVVRHLKHMYPTNLAKWRDKDLRHFFHSRNWADFKSKLER